MQLFNKKDSYKRLYRYIYGLVREKDYRSYSKLLIKHNITFQQRRTNKIWHEYPLLYTLFKFLQTTLLFTKLKTEALMIIDVCQTILLVIYRNICSVIIFSFHSHYSSIYIYIILLYHAPSKIIFSELLQRTRVPKWNFGHMTSCEVNILCRWSTFLTAVGIYNCSM